MRFNSFKLSGLMLYLLLFGFTLLMFVVARGIFWVMVAETLNTAPIKDIWKALYIGLRFDARLAALLTLPFGIMLTIPPLGRQLNKWRNKIFIAYFMIFFAVWSIYGLDFGFYTYLGTRINATVIELAQDMQASIEMVWSSYPAVKILLGLAALSLFCAWVFKRILKAELIHARTKFRQATAWLCGFMIFAWAVYGQISSNLFPLRWSNAYFSANQTVSALALNPIQNFYDTYVASLDDGFDLALAQKYYPLISDFLQVDNPDIKNLNYERTTPAAPAVQRPPNIVIIIMESMGHVKSSFAPGEANPTPFLKQLASESVYFPWFFSNTRTTARAVFTTITGIPDVTESSTGSRNQLVIDQQVIPAEFKGYEKFYMLGGNANWANIRGVIGNNIPGIKILEETYWKAPNVDVWGISDLDLLLESHELFTKSGEKPFLAIIQTASFHRPFTIPENTPGFERQTLDEKKRAYYSFVSEDEYNSMRYSDFALAEFFRKARQSTYYANTIFILFGDHGINDSCHNMDAAYIATDLAPWHVPLLIHAPGRLKPDVNTMPASQIDIFPTAAALAGIEYRNLTLGRNLFDQRFANSQAAYVGGKKTDDIRLVKDGYCYFDNRAGLTALYRFGDNKAEDYSQKEVERFKKMQDLANAIHYTAKYMLYNNKKK